MGPAGSGSAAGRPPKATSVGHRAGGRGGRGLAEVGHGQGRAQLQPARQRRPHPRAGAASRTRRRLQRQPPVLTNPSTPSVSARSCLALSEVTSPHLPRSSSSCRGGVGSRHRRGPAVSPPPHGSTNRCPEFDQHSTQDLAGLLSVSPVTSPQCSTAQFCILGGLPAKTCSQQYASPSRGPLVADSRCQRNRTEHGP
jgi:hypothetical protein